MTSVAEPHPLERFVSPPRVVTEADVDAFAALTGDRHPQHVDAAWAASSRFGERIAHGLLVLSCAAGLVDFDPDRVVALRRVADVVFKQPVRLGDAIRTEGAMGAVRDLDDEHALVELKLRVLNQHDRLVMRATLEVVWRRAEVPG